MRLVALLLILCPIAVMAGTRELSRGTPCGTCVFSLCTTASGYFEECADPCAAEVAVRVPVNRLAAPRMRTSVGRGKKHTRLRCDGLGAPCFLCATDADCHRDEPPGLRPVCVSRVCRYICPSGVVLE
jgi:hypothetical protein